MNKKIKISEMLYNEIQENMGNFGKKEMNPVELDVIKEKIYLAMKENKFEDVIYLAHMAKKALQYPLNEYNKEVMASMKKQYGEKRGEAVYYATANKEGRNPETFELDGEK